MDSPKSTLVAFRHRAFRTLWTASLISNLGALIQLVGAAWLMTSLTASEQMVALVQASVTLPIMLTSLAAGVLADNYNRRFVMLWAQLFMLAVSVILTVLAFAQMLGPWILLMLTFLIGCGTALHHPSWQSSMRELVPREDLPQAVALNAMGMNITRSVGPAIGGALVATLGVAAAFAVNAITYFALITALLGWRNERPTRHLPRERFDHALFAGLKFAILSPDLTRSIFRGFVFGFAAIAAQALAPLLASIQLGGDAAVYGVLLGTFGAGAVTGGFVTVHARARFNNEAICRLGFTVAAIANVGLAVSTNIALSASASFLAGVCWINVLSLINVTVQLSSPRWVLGRTLALYMTGIFGGMALGSWVWGIVSERFGIPVAFLGAASVLVAGALWGLRSPLPEPATANLDPMNQFREPAIAFDLTRYSGPIMLMVEYEIDQNDVPNFLVAMRDRRQVRLRNGARNWVLTRNLEYPRLWIETYHFPTWTEYIRHNDRKTYADDEIGARLHALHKACLPLKVHRLIERQTVVPQDDTPPIDPKPSLP